MTSRVRAERAGGSSRPRNDSPYPRTGSLSFSQGRVDGRSDAHLAGPFKRRIGTPSGALVSVILLWMVGLAALLNPLQAAAIGVTTTHLSQAALTWNGTEQELYLDLVGDSLVNGSTEAPPKVILVPTPSEAVVAVDSDDIWSDLADVTDADVIFQSQAEDQVDSDPRVGTWRSFSAADVDGLNRWLEQYGAELIEGQARTIAKYQQGGWSVVAIIVPAESRATWRVSFETAQPVFTLGAFQPVVVSRSFGLWLVADQPLTRSDAAVDAYPTTSVSTHPLADDGRCDLVTSKALLRACEAGKIVTAMELPAMTFISTETPDLTFAAAWTNGDDQEFGSGVAAGENVGIWVGSGAVIVTASVVLAWWLQRRARRA